MKEISELLERELKTSLRLLKKKLRLNKCLVPKPPEIGDLRRLEAWPPIYLLLVEEFPLHEEKLFKCLVFTEDIELGTLKGDTPFLLLEKEKIILVGLPLWIYSMDALLQDYSTWIGSFTLEKIKEFIHYAEKTPIPETPQGEYIKAVAKFLSPINTSSLFEYLESLEKEAPQILRLEERVFEPYREYQFSLAASSKRIFKGENWLALVEESESKARLILYLPQDYLGKKIKITLGEKVLFEGELESDQIILEDIPLFVDYSFLEEALSVQI